MFDSFLISTKEISKFKVIQKNPLSLTCEKITETPRVFNTTQIKGAIENISLINIEENILPDIIPRVIEYVLKDFFLYMHQTGLYNRQLKLWQTMGNITQCLVYKLQKGFLKKTDLNVYMANFFIDPRNPCISIIINENSEDDLIKLFFDLNIHIKKSLGSTKPDRLKGIFYFQNTTFSNDFTNKLEQMTDTNDPISKYESLILNTKDVRLNVLSFKKENEKYAFEHVYPEIRGVKTRKEETMRPSK